LLYKFYIFY